MRVTGKWMRLGSALIAPSLLFLALNVVAETKPPVPETKPAHRRHNKKPATPPLVLPPLPAGPLPQMPMDMMPAAPPKVGFQGGMLTIVAQNSTLSDILHDVRKLTGASIDVPANANERVVTRLGPGAPRDVLASLLNGSSFNYVMVGSDTDPAAVTSIVLTPKSGGNQPATTASTFQPAQGPAPAPFVPRPVVPQPAAQPPASGDDENANAEDQDSTGDENADQDQSQGDAGANPAAVAQPDQQQPQPPVQPGQPNAGPKTPEQILEILRRQQPGNPGNPPQPPDN